MWRNLNGLFPDISLEGRGEKCHVKVKKSRNSLAAVFSCKIKARGKKYTYCDTVPVYKKDPKKAVRHLGESPGSHT